MRVNTLLTRTETKLLQSPKVENQQKQVLVQPAVQPAGVSGYMFDLQRHYGNNFVQHLVRISQQGRASNQGHKVKNASVLAAGKIMGVIQRDSLPVAKFSPTPSITIDRTDKSVAISGNLEIYGPQATAARSAQIQNTINTIWTQSFPDGYTVFCNVVVNYRGTGSEASANSTQIKVDNIAGPSYVSGNSMVLNASGQEAFTWVVAHEFGHLLGLRDHYSESIMSKLLSGTGAKRTTTIEPSYTGNLMGEHRGALESKNLKDLAEETAPSPYWINDDNQIRDWVNSHNLREIGRLSTTNKLKAIKVLMGGWISDDDVATISRICSSVSSSPEANAIRRGIDLLSMTSIGQRTMVRVALAKMP